MNAESVAAWLAEVEGNSKRLAARFHLAPDGSDLYGVHCPNCQQNWTLPADRATCPHLESCESCYPNGCVACETEVEADLSRREKAAHLILSAALELRTQADDLTDTDLGALDWLTRNDVLRHVELTIEALLRVRDVMRSQTAGSKP